MYLVQEIKGFSLCHFSIKDEKPFALEELLGSEDG